MSYISPWHYSLEYILGLVPQTRWSRLYWWIQAERSASLSKEMQEGTIIQGLGLTPLLTATLVREHSVSQADRHVCLVLRFHSEQLYTWDWEKSLFTALLAYANRAHFFFRSNKHLRDSWESYSCHRCWSFSRCDCCPHSHLLCSVPAQVSIFPYLLHSAQSRCKLLLAPVNSQNSP